MPTVSVELGNLPTNSTWLIDFNSDITVVWAENCKQGDDNTSCTESPLYLDCDFVTTSPSLGDLTTIVGGYKVSGNFVKEKIKIGGDNIFMKVLEGTNVTGNYWLKDYQGGSYGVLGFGPGSYLWSGFIDQQTNTTTYSISMK